ncbi:RNA binding protein, heterogenous nuclear RNP-K like protein [Cladochytrium tenue]|nr:RNA binding protein, heterogenous nuclear RNP-K like protein [Cladochytrium tenue]
MPPSDTLPFAADQTLARLTGLTLNPETPPHFHPSASIFHAGPGDVPPPADIDDDEEEDEDEEEDDDVEADEIDVNEEQPLVSRPPAIVPTSPSLPNSNGQQAAQTSAETKPPTTVTLRALVSTKEAGVIIGKGGKNVADIRSVTNVKAGVSKVVSGVSERILTVSGTSLAVAKAYSIVARHILESPISTPQPPVYADCTTIRLLVAHQLMGSIIGKGGAKIKEIQEESGAKLVIAKEMLPQSTERIVEIFGLVDSIKIAIYNIAECILNDIDRAVGTILYNPQARAGGGSPTAGRSGRSEDDDGAAAGRPSGSSASNGNGGAPAERRNRRSSHAGDFGAGKAGLYSAFVSNNGVHFVYRHGGASSLSSSGLSRRASTGAQASSGGAGELVQTVAIPSDMIGCVIGKAGSFINSIRRQSGARLRISDAAADSTADRIITISGPSAANARALTMIHDQLEWERQRRLAAQEEEDEGYY